MPGPDERKTKVLEAIVGEDPATLREPDADRSSGQTQGAMAAAGLPPPPAPPAPAASIATPTPVKRQAVDQPTAMLDVNRAPKKAVVVPTIMQQKPAEMGALPIIPPSRPDRSWLRWLVGPLVSVIVALGTWWIARQLMPIAPREVIVKKIGKLRLNSEPPGAAVRVDGKVLPHFTPTTIEGTVNSSIHLSFSLEGYETKESDIYVTEGEHPFAVKLEREEPEPIVVETPPPAPLQKGRHHHRHPVARPGAPSAPETPQKGQALLSVFVRPWAILMVDGRKIHQTPVQNFIVSPGRHTLELVNPTINRKEQLIIEVRDGENKEVRRDWDK